jgi:hypothetical protein
MSSTTGKHLAGDLRRDAEHLEVVVGRVHAERLVKARPRMVAHVHRGEDRQHEEPHPELVDAGQQLGIGPHQECEGLAMAELVVAPLLEPLEDRVEAALGMTLETGGRW